MVERFAAEMASLLVEINQLSDGIDADMATLKSEGAAVSWTGANRQAFDGDLVTFGAAVLKGTTAIREDLASINSEIETKFVPAIVEMRTKLSEKAQLVNADTTTMSTAVATQRDNLDLAANTGWTGA